MITLKNSELELTCMTIIAYTPENQPVFGLLMENISLGMKRRLQKIHNAAMTALKEYNDNIVVVTRECGEDATKLKHELQVLADEPVTIDVEMLSLAAIEAIQTKANYDFTIIEKFAA